MKAQGATEYLVQLGAVLFIALIVIGVLAFPVESTKDAKKKQTDVQFKIAAMEYPDLLQGMVAYYKFDDGSGSNAINSIGGSTATLVNSPSWVGGKSGTALSFNSANYVNCGESGIVFGTNPHTYVAWINSPAFSSSLNYIVATGNSATGQQSGIAIRDTGKFALSAYSSPIVYFNNPTFQANAWQHVAMVYDGEYANLYVNGTFVERQAIALNTTVGKCRIAANVGNTPNFNGTIDEVMIFNRALLAGEIRLLYENPGYPQ